MNIKTALKVLIVPVTVAIYIGCSPVNFAKDNEMHKCQDFAGNCVVANGRDYFDETFTVAGGLVDILIVNDNSASMSFEQKLLSQRLANFVRNLESQHTDYRIAITTTDISAANNPARAVNLNGALQDGKLIQFANGQYFLTPSSGSIAQKDEWFRKAIERPETLACESFIQANYGTAGYEGRYAENCPSGDERGTYAANLAISRNSNSFIRTNAHLAVIFLADEDVRSQLYYRPSTSAGFELAELDTADSLISTVSKNYGGKVLTVHSLITATQECLKTQNEQMKVNGQFVVNGSYGLVYAEASKKTKGVIGDICESDYTTRLGQISANILDRKDNHMLACEAPGDLEVTIKGQSGVTHTVDGRELKFGSQLNPGTEVRVKYSCQTL